MNVFTEPVTLTGPLVRLVPMHPDHHDALVEAVRDGELWNTRVSMDDYYDREGYPWSRREFW